MNKVLLSVALALGLCGSGCFSQSTDKNDIRFVDVDRILTQSKTARVRDSHIEAVNPLKHGECGYRSGQSYGGEP